MNPAPDFAAAPPRTTFLRNVYHHRWKILGAGVVACFVLGLIGYWQLYRSALPWPDRIYAALSLFRDTTTLYSGQHPPFPWALEVARFVAPLLLVLAGLSALMALFSAQMSRLVIRLTYRNHLIICGLGEFGVRLAIKYDDIGRRVVVIDANPPSLAVSQCRKRLIPVLVGDATDPEALLHAGAAWANHIVAVCGDDGINGQIGLTVRKLHTRTVRLKCTVHIDDEAVCSLLEESELSVSGDLDASARIHYLNVYRSGPLVLKRSLWDSFSEVTGEGPHIVVVGTDAIGLRFVVNAAREWWFDHRGTLNDHQGSDKKMRIALVAPNADEQGKTLRAQYPHFDEACHFECYAYDLTELEPPKGTHSEDEHHDGAHNEDGEAQVRAFLESDGWSASTVFVTYPEERDSLAAAKALAKIAERLPHLTIRVVTTGSITSITPLLDAMLQGDRYKNVKTLSLLDEVCQPRFFDGDLTEEIAKALHKDFLEGQDEADKKRGHRVDKPTRVAWEVLDEEYRESNRAQANRYDRILGARGYSIELTDDWNRGAPDFSAEDIEAMAKQEHELWVRYQLDHGWRLGPRDNEKRIRPDLVSWHELDDLNEPNGLEQKETTKKYVRNAPGLLIRFGMAVKGPRRNKS